MSKKMGVGSQFLVEVADGDWRRLSKLTPLFVAWKILIAGLLIGGIKVFNNLSEQGVHWQKILFTLRTQIGVVLFWLVLGVGVLLLLVLGYAIVAWKRMRFAVTAEVVVFERGILFRESKHVRIDRVQAVDVIRPFVAGLFGLAQVRVENAGGKASHLDIGFLKVSECNDLRREILDKMHAALHKTDGLVAASVVGTVASGGSAARVAVSTGAGLGVDAGSGQDSGVDAEVATVCGSWSGTEMGTTEVVSSGQQRIRRLRELVTLDRELEDGVVVVAPSNQNLIFGSIFHVERLLVLAVILFSTGLPVWIMLVRNPVGFSLGSLLPVVSVLFVFGYRIWSEIQGSFNKTIRVTADGIRVRRGLTVSVTQTIRPERVLCISLHQNLVDRIFDWWNVRITVAGYGVSEDDDSGDKTDRSELLRVGTREEAIATVWMLVPDLGVPDPDRFLQTAMYGVREDGAFVSLPSKARVFNLLAWGRNGICNTDAVVMVRKGFLRRSLLLMPHGRTQSITLRQGPLQRRLGLASINFPLPGVRDCSLSNLDSSEAGQLFSQQADIARRFRRGENLDDWFERMAKVFPQLGAELEALTKRSF